MADMDQIVEMKMTRNEIIDLIIEEMTEELDKRIEAALAAEQAADEKFGEFGNSWVTDYLPTKFKDEDIRVEYPYRGATGENALVTVRLTARIPASKIPKERVALQQACEAATQVVRNLRAEKRTLTENKGKARIQVIRQSLESNPQGQQILKMIEGVKGKMKQQLLPSGNK